MPSSHILGDRSRRHFEPEARQLRLDPALTPKSVLDGHATYQDSRLGGNREATRLPFAAVSSGCNLSRTPTFLWHQRYMQRIAAIPPTSTSLFATLRGRYSAPISSWRTSTAVDALLLAPARRADLSTCVSSSMFGGRGDESSVGFSDALQKAAVHCFRQLGHARQLGFQLFELRVIAFEVEHWS
jgi:hypothetical protein